MKNNEVKIAVIGAGWYGCDLAIFLREKGMDVTVFEKNERIFTGVSGDFGVRLHAGPHYPRSRETRRGCSEGLVKFLRRFPELVNHHRYSHYGLGKVDADGNPSKVGSQDFRKVCHEVNGFVEVSPDELGYDGSQIHMLADIPEPSCVVGERLRIFFEKSLKDVGVRVRCNTEVRSITNRSDNTLSLEVDGRTEFFDFAINATGFKCLLPNGPLPYLIDVRYQPCLALVYEDMRDRGRDNRRAPFSTIVMDGWFPCMMPYDDRIREDDGTSLNKYIITHGKWTILGSYLTDEEADNQLASLGDELVLKKIKPNCEKEMARFWPEFTAENFKYLGWKGRVLCKIKTNREFRGAFSFQSDESGIIYVFPGKITNVFDIEQEVLSLIEGRNIKQVGGYSFLEGGVLDRATPEIEEEITQPNTCDLNTLRNISQKETRKNKIRYQVLRGLIFFIFFLFSKISFKKALISFIMIEILMLNNSKSFFIVAKKSCISIFKKTLGENKIPIDRRINGH